MEYFKTAVGNDSEVRDKLSALGLRFTNKLDLRQFAIGERYLVVEFGAVSFYPFHEWRAYEADSAPELSKEQIMDLC